MGENSWRKIHGGEFTADVQERVKSVSGRKGEKMKYGYLYYRKGLLENKKERPMNLGDPVQSLAALGILRKIGIKEEDIIPMDRYDLAVYEGEKVILLVNGAETYEHYAYHTKFLPVSENIIPVFIGIHLHRELSEEELTSFREHQPVGCRDEFTVSYLREKGIDAFLSGCLTLTFPKRQETAVQNKVFLVDCPEGVEEYMPEELVKDAVRLSQILRIKSKSESCRLTDEEADYYSETAEKQLFRLRDEAALVVTSRLHVAAPCVAMGIPVVLAKEVFDGRYRFIDRFLPLYTPEKYGQIDWRPKVGIGEEVKEEIVSMCRCLIGVAAGRERLRNVYLSGGGQNLFFRSEEEAAVCSLPMEPEEEFTYAIWGVCMPNSYLLYEAMQKKYVNARMVCAIDTWAEGVYKDSVPIISPEDMEEKLGKGTLILVVAPAAHEDAVRRLEGRGYRFALMKGAEVRLF